MSPRLAWRQLVPGLIALAIIAAITAGMIAFGGIGRLRGDTVRLHIITNQARGLIRGSDVWLGGQRVGTVAGMDFLPPAADTTRRLVVLVDVLEEEASRITRNSVIRIRAGGNVIGPVIVDVEPGTPSARSVRDGDTLYAVVQSDLELAGMKLAEASGDVEPLFTNARTVLRSVRDTNGSLGALIAHGFGGEVSDLRANFARLGGRGRRAGPTASQVAARARVSLARVDSIRALLASPSTSYGRYKRDSTLPQAIAELRDELGELNAMLRESGGTSERFAKDSALVRAVAAARVEMAELFADVRRRPIRYIAF